MPLNSLVTRALNVLRSSASADNTDATVASIARKITSTRTAAKKEATATAADVKVATKRLMKQGQQAATLQRIEQEGHTFGQLLRGPAAKEAFSAFMQKRRPDFSGC